MKRSEIRKFIRKEIQNIVYEWSIAKSLGRIIGSRAGRDLKKGKDYRGVKQDAEQSVQDLSKRIKHFNSKVKQFRDKK